jgi:hypothetical protein
MIIDVLYRAGDGERHGWRIRVRKSARPYAVTVWGSPEKFGLTYDRAVTEALCRTMPTCARVIVIIWSRFMRDRSILVGRCLHNSKHRHAILPTKAAG